MEQSWEVPVNSPKVQAPEQNKWQFFKTVGSRALGYAVRVTHRTGDNVTSSIFLSRSEMKGRSYIMPWFGGWQDGGENLGDFKTLNKNGKEDPEEGACRRGLLLFSQEKEGGTFIQGKKD